MSRRSGHSLIETLFKSVLPCAIALLMLASGIVRAEDDETPIEDCRYRAQDGNQSSSNNSSSQWLPADDVFRPLMADPKQPQFFASYQTTEVRTSGSQLNVGSVGFGENFGLWTRRDGCNGWQVSLLSGIFSQFNMDAPSTDLLNTDFVVGIPISWRQGPFSARVRLYHQSSHLGDEFLLRNPDFNRINLSYEEVEALLSLDVKWVRMYGGGGYLIHRQPAFDRSRAQWGMELRGPEFAIPFLGETGRHVMLVPVLGADFKAIEQLSWTLNTNVVAGFEMSSSRARRRIRFLISYYNGFAPYGQFANLKVETIGAGIYLTF
ncbi:MAG: DUF1207 domain-containing protein [Nitrospira sp.]|nr:DUF1207 domain-containing protein [Nitrospira sp.]